MKLTEHQSSATTKLLYIGDSKSGKTGSLASLVEAGYNLYILDFDNGIDVLRNILLQKNPALLSQVDYFTLTDPYKFVAGQPIPRLAQAWAKASDLLTSWPDKGPLETWGTKDVLVIDSLTFAGRACMNWYLQLNNRLGQLPKWNDWHAPQSKLLDLLAALYATSVKCNVIVLSHIVQIGQDVTKLDDKGMTVKETRPGSERGYATALGKAISPMIGRFFNGLIMAQSEPYGAGVRRRIHTDSVGVIELANPNPLVVKKSYPIETGLADYFKAVRGE